MKKIYIKSYLLKYISIKSYLINKLKIQNLNRKKSTKTDKDDRSKWWICEKTLKLKLKKAQMPKQKFEIKIGKVQKPKLKKHKSFPSFFSVASLCAQARVLYD